MDSTPLYWPLRFCFSDLRGSDLISAIEARRQPPKMHKGTLFLVEDLVLEIERLEERVARLERQNRALRARLGN